MRHVIDDVYELGVELSRRKMKRNHKRGKANDFPKLLSKASGISQ